MGNPTSGKRKKSITFSCHNRDVEERGDIEKSQQKRA